MPESWVTQHVGDEVQPRPGFEDELAADLVAAWRGEGALVPLATGRPRSRRWWWLAAAAVVVLALAAVVVVRARDGSSPRPAGPPSTAVVTVAPTSSSTSMLATTTAPTSTPTTTGSTVAPSTSAVVVPPTVTSPPISTGPASPRPEGFDPPCTESVGATGATSAVDEADLDTFGPLGSTSMATVTLPSGWSKLWSSSQLVPSVAEPARIPGGVLLNVRSGNTGFPGSMLVALGHDAAVRWVRCYADIVGVTVAPVSSGSPTALVATYQPSTQGDDWQVIDLADGAPRGELADVLTDAGIDTASLDSRMQPVASNDHELVFGPPMETKIEATRDRLVRLDLATMTPTLIPFPEVADGVEMVFHHFGYVAGDALALLGSGQDQPAVLAAFVSGAWSTAPADLSQFDGIRADYPLVTRPDTPLEGRDGHGNVVWRAPTINMGPSTEGFQRAASGDVTVVRSCLGTFDEQNGCPNRGIAGVRTRDGKVLWKLPGRYVVATVGDGYAIVGGPPTDLPDGQTGPAYWTMIDTDTGKDVPGQRWDDPTAFEVGCCGSDAHVWRFGGVVAAVSTGTVALWYPAAIPPGDATVTVP
ncbi:MAG: hypothetical protein QM733_22025 [Ilumatobacteraceae bacterium]